MGDDANRVAELKERLWVEWERGGARGSAESN